MLNSLGCTGKSIITEGHPSNHGSYLQNNIRKKGAWKRSELFIIATVELSGIPASVCDDL